MTKIVNSQTLDASEDYAYENINIYIIYKSVKQGWDKMSLCWRPICLAYATLVKSTLHS